jgi:CubicO group peptidase (beta-lactamase class C family)
MAATKIQIEQRPGRVFNATQAFQWPESAPEDSGLDVKALEKAAQLAADNASDSLLVISDGRLVLERYWNGKTASDVQQTYSGTKSLFALLVGRAIHRGYIEDLDQPVRESIPEMPESQGQLTFRNVLAMESGMENSMRIENLGRTGRTQLEIALERQITSAPFECYHYNNAAYRLLFTALERASGMDLEALTEREVFEPLSFDGAYWMRLYAVNRGEERFTGYQSIRMTPSDFAKSAQVIVADGMWADEQFLSTGYIRDLIRSPAPAVNPSFGLFHHLNAGDFYCNFAEPDRIERQLVPGSPRDLFLMFGSGGQVVAGIPSRKLVVVRTGGNAGSIYEKDNYIARLLRSVVEAQCPR